MAPGGRAASGVAWAFGRLGRLPAAHVLDAVAAARRIASWAQGVEMMAAVELFERPGLREDGSPLPGPLAAVHRDSVLEEIAAKLRVTSGTAAYLVAQGTTLRRRFPRVLALLLSGRLDIPKVNAFVNGCAFVSDEHAALVQDRLIDVAEALTSGQLRSKIAKLVIDVDPEAAERRRRAGEARVRMSVWRNAEKGTATFALADSPLLWALAASQRVDGLARRARTQGDQRPLERLRVLIAYRLLLGYDPETLSRLPQDGPNPDHPTPT
ncbi:13E12 repeat family protein, partial [Planotetraspora sp. A-T 1434]|uniref:13E12 repeat family protein n=1 Tax=Planotetraspora sp. A-T 1434 TaxID=2979219 RepID=UPI0021C1B019